MGGPPVGPQPLQRPSERAAGVKQTFGHAHLLFHCHGPSAAAACVPLSPDGQQQQQQHWSEASLAKQEQLPEPPLRLFMEGK